MGVFRATCHFLTRPRPRGCRVPWMPCARRAEVISADMFATRFQADCMDKAAGMDYRKQVLGPGGTGKIMEHLKVFLGGREPEQAPFLKSRGILKTEE